VIDVQESWRTGLIKRPDLAQLRTELERRDIDIKYRKNQTLPDLSLVGTYGRQAVGPGFEKVFGDLNFRDKAVDYYYGVELSFPWGNRQAKFRLAQEKDQRLQTELVLQQLQQNIMVQIDDSINSIKTSFDRISATRAASEFALKVLQAEESKEGVGMSTPFQILQYQKDLTTARSQEVRAIADYNKALARLAQAEGTTLERLKLTLEFK
jgi:outer membrane protein TolC